LRLVIQRVLKAEVQVNPSVISQINQGLLVFLGIHKDDTLDPIDYLIEKMIHLRLFEDDQDKMNHSVKDIDGEVLIVSQFTLYADCTKGRRPSFVDAAKPDIAHKIYDEFVKRLKLAYPKTSQGEFGADMKITLINDGPVTMIVEK